MGRARCLAGNELCMIPGRGAVRNFHARGLFFGIMSPFRPSDTPSIPVVASVSAPERLHQQDLGRSHFVVPVESRRPAHPRNGAVLSSRLICPSRCHQGQSSPSACFVSSFVSECGLANGRLSGVQPMQRAPVAVVEFMIYTYHGASTTSRQLILSHRGR